jgi:hypothetical protein
LLPGVHTEEVTSSILVPVHMRFLLIRRFGITAKYSNRPAVQAVTQPL